MQNNDVSLSGLVRDNQDALLQEWLSELPQARKGALADNARQAREFLRLLDKDGVLDGCGKGNDGDLDAFLADFSRERALAGYASDETAQFIFGLKRTLLRLIQQRLSEQPQELTRLALEINTVLDNLGLRTVRFFQKGREEVIQRQQQELLELSTPVVKLWQGILALPIIGTLDSARTQVMMESLLQRIADSEAQIAIIDITGVPTVDTMVAQHLIKTVTAIRLMGADCIISGVRPQIAQTIVHLGVDLGAVTTKANIADALSLALHKLGLGVGKRAG